VVDDPSSADTVIVNSERVAIDRRQIQYALSDDPDRARLAVERLHFVDVCIRMGRFKNTAAIDKPLPGRPEGSAFVIWVISNILPRLISHVRREAFTQDDDERLTRYLATRCGDAARGGRSGTRVFKQLVDLASHTQKRFFSAVKFIGNTQYDGSKEFKWVRRHPWLSWRNRYTKKKAFFDEEIKEYLQEYGPLNKKASYAYDARMRKKYQALAEEEEEEEEGEGDQNQNQNQNQPQGPNVNQADEIDPQFDRQFSEDLPIDPRPPKRSKNMNASAAAEKRRRIDNAKAVTFASPKVPQPAKGKAKIVPGPEDHYEM
jgi:hypothetical protein